MGRRASSFAARILNSSRCHPEDGGSHPRDLTTAYATHATDEIRQTACRVRIHVHCNAASADVRSFAPASPLLRMTSAFFCRGAIFELTSTAMCVIDSNHLPVTSLRHPNVVDLSLPPGPWSNHSHIWGNTGKFNLERPSRGTCRRWYEPIWHCDCCVSSFPPPEAQTA